MNSKKRLNRALGVSALCLILGGCAVGSPYQRPQADMPAAWQTPGVQDAQSSSVETVAGSQIDATWWQAFGSAELDGLMQQAMSANRDLAAALQRIEQARAAAGIAGASRLPSANASLSGSKNRSDSGPERSSDASQLGLSVAYEADLWGLNAASAAAARARLQASVFDRDAVALMLQAEVANTYFQALSLQDRIAIARKNLDAARQVLALVDLRFENGAISGLEVAQQRTSVLNLEAQLPQLEQDYRNTLSALALLLGQAPQGFDIQGKSLASLQVPAIAAFQPPGLLERRPDIQRTEAQLVAASADLRAARAALYPNLKLSASATASGILTGGSGLASSLVASLAQVIFDGGRLSGQAQQSAARQAELVQQYLQDILTALKEVQDSLGATTTTATRQALLEQAADQAAEANRIASVKYRAGSSDLLTVLDSQRTQYSAEDSALQARYNRLTATVNLVKALGGGWQRENSDRAAVLKTNAASLSAANAGIKTAASL